MNGELIAVNQRGGGEAEEAEVEVKLKFSCLSSIEEVEKENINEIYHFFFSQKRHVKHGFLPMLIGRKHFLGGKNLFFPSFSSFPTMVTSSHFFITSTARCSPFPSPMPLLQCGER